MIRAERAGRLCFAEPNQAFANRCIVGKVAAALGELPSVALMLKPTIFPDDWPEWWR
jgi:hypothetical protein